MNRTWLFKPHTTLLEGDTENTLYNLSGDYTYLLEGYYESVFAMLNNIDIHPTAEECLDAYIVALALEKGKLHGLSVPEYQIITDKTKYVNLPVLGYTMNPFSNASYVINDPKIFSHKVKSLTLSGKYFALIQNIPSEDFRIDTVRLILGKSNISEYKDFGRQIFQIFKIPLMKIKIIVTKENYYFSAIESLPYDSLSINEKKLIEGMGVWQR